MWNPRLVVELQCGESDYLNQLTRQFPVRHLRSSELHKEQVQVQNAVQKGSGLRVLLNLKCSS